LVDPYGHPVDDLVVDLWQIAADGEGRLLGPSEFDVVPPGDAGGIVPQPGGHPWIENGCAKKEFDPREVFAYALVAACEAVLARP